jgi:hypothetical protein
MLLKKIMNAPSILFCVSSWAEVQKEDRKEKELFFTVKWRQIKEI